MVAFKAEDSDGGGDIGSVGVEVGEVSQIEGVGLEDEEIVDGGCGGDTGCIGFLGSGVVDRIGGEN